MGEKSELLVKIEEAVKAEFAKLREKLHNLFDDHGEDTHVSLDTIVNETHTAVIGATAEHTEASDETKPADPAAQ